MRREVDHLHAGTSALSHHEHSTKVLNLVRTRKKQFVDGQPAFSPHFGLH